MEVNWIHVVRISINYLLSFHCVCYFSGLTWAFYYVARYPEIQDKIAAEIKEVLGDKKVSPATINDMK